MRHATLVLWLGMAGALGVVGCGSTNLPGLDAEDPWGKETGGLRIRADGPGSAARGDAVDVEIEFEVQETRLRQGRLKLDRRPPATFARLRLTPTNGKAKIVVVPYDPDQGMPTPPPPSGVWPTWGLANETPDPVTISFPLARVWDQTSFDGYTAVVELVYGDGAHGTWRGTVRSAPFALTLSASEPTPMTFEAPTRLSVAGRDIVYGDGDVERLPLAVRNGFSVGLRVRRSDGEDMLLGGVVVPEVPRPLGRLNADTPSGSELRFWMELFETADSPEHLWRPAPGSGSYRTLWKREYVVRAP